MKLSKKVRQLFSMCLGVLSIFGLAKVQKAEPKMGQYSKADFRDIAGGEVRSDPCERV